jgi:Leucine-rich repeat (LRR) protein
MKWNYSDYDLWLYNGAPINPNITELFLSGNAYTNVDHISKLPNLVRLHCECNKIENFDNLILHHLTSLYCNGNNLSHLDNFNLSTVPKLKILFCYNNPINNLNNLNLPHLECLSCSWLKLNCLDNLNIRTVPMLKELSCNGIKMEYLNLNLPNLFKLDCGCNKIKQLILDCPMLQELNCQCNLIIDLELNCPILQELNCCNNKIKYLDKMNLPNLKILCCANNPITQLCLLNIGKIERIYYDVESVIYIAPNLWRAINKPFKSPVNPDYIEQCFKQSIQKVINIKATIINPTKYIVDDAIFDNNCKRLLLEFMKDDRLHPTLLITFEEFMCHILSRIEISSDCDKIKLLLNHNITDSLITCHTGQYVNIIKCFNNFNKLAQIKQIILLCKEILITYNQYSIKKHKDKSYIELLDRGYHKDVIEQYLI